ncbi:MULTISPECIES: hypothetical protein [Rhizobium/Agrobacterium group]|uniref:hypothetical protein n=1 Tax=Rhizobium/Agrobacterium group TaxID=227290 RepID=UPI0003F1EAC8|nr:MULTISPECIES: hypothetical protein [Rhizobium/Agrobacterium group]AHK02732.1 hypothetical protein X971_2871 [Agrobacterium tumefaciens LBA4213 (Ach5)]AKC08533.1 hypothetical protein Ach5_27600 [Agrobacterium tumefaciens]AYM17675.1 hypothetical protein At15955_26900 [Agrobacterium tumefaciens]AYM68974.1 hypothetical protein AtA6_27580 [Agrobacterium tumefaciens]NIB58266.1 hypothetical protein [Agrobacterium tumefaciens]
MADILRKLYRTVVIASLAAAGGCGGPQFREDTGNTPVVPTQAVIDTLKCGLSNAVALDTLDRSGIRSAIAVVKLDVNVVNGSTITGSASAGIPISSGAGNFSPSFSASREATLTNNTTTEFDITISKGDGAACQAIRGRFQDAGFSSWLAQNITDINRAVAGPPYASMKKYVYDSHFIVKRSANAGLSFDIVPVKVGASVDTSRSDIQHINVTIEAVTVREGKPPGRGGRWFNTERGGL